MFAAICTRPQWFKERLNLFCALAPVARLEAAKSQKLHEVLAKKVILDTFISALPCFSFMEEANASNAFKGSLIQLFKVGPAILRQIADEDPSMMSLAGCENYMGHYPAGASLK